MKWLVLFCLLIAAPSQAQTVAWTSNRGDSGQGDTIIGTNWTITGVPLKAGINLITVTYTNTNGTANDSVTITYTPTHPGNALVSAYAFKDGTGSTATDSTINAFNGALVNGPVWTTVGKFDNALTFDGTDSYVSVPDANALDFTQSFTISAWIKPTNTTGWRTIAAKGQDVNAESMPVQFLYATQPGSQGCVAGRIQAGFISNGILGPRLNICSTVPLATGVYSHVAVTYDGANLRLYINGVLNATVAATGLMEPSTLAWKIGADDYGDAFAGDIDEVRLYNYAIPLTAASNTVLSATCTATNFVDNVTSPSVIGNANCPIISVTPPLPVKIPADPSGLKVGAAGIKFGQVEP